jgi:hypothetical protein
MNHWSAGSRVRVDAPAGRRDDSNADLVEFQRLGRQMFRLLTLILYLHAVTDAPTVVVPCLIKYDRPGSIGSSDIKRLCLELIGHLGWRIRGRDPSP